MTSGRFRDQPQPMADILATLARRIRKVDLLVIDEVRTLWPTIVDEVVATRCHPEFVKNGVLVIGVPSGAFAQRLIEEETSILTGLAVLGERAPVALRPLVSPS